MKLQSLAGVFLSFLPVLVHAGDDDWVSPVYKPFYSVKLPIPPVAVPKTSYTNPETGITIDFYEITIERFQQQIYPGKGPANLVGYNGIAPGPTIKVNRGTETVVRFVNKYDRPSAIHLHGSYSRVSFDGWAEDVINPGQYKDYYYPNNQEPRTLWYHDHAIHITALNAYYGQAGMYILTDPGIEAQLGLPQGDYDIPLVLQSKQYKSNGDLFSPENERESLYGDVFHVNGQPWPFFDPEPRKYRFRVLNAAISRSFKLSLTEEGKSTKIPFHVVAADGGYLNMVVQTSDLWLSMAERYEIVVDFAPYKGKTLILKNARDVGKDEDYGGTDRVMAFKVKNTAPRSMANNNIPTSMRPLDFPPKKTNVDRKFKFEKKNGLWTINGVVFSDVKNRILAKPQRGFNEVWELENSSGGWSHPIHIHLVDFNIISRSGGRGSVMPYEAQAFKDVTWLGPNEKVRVIAKYSPWEGIYMFHCHNLIHEDHDMMAAFNVTELKNFGYTEKTKFIDPMEPRWRAKDMPPGGTDLQKVVTETLPFFASQDAYNKVHEAQQKLDEYWGYPKSKRDASSGEIDERDAGAGAVDAVLSKKWVGSGTQKVRTWSKKRRQAAAEGEVGA